MHSRVSLTLIMQDAVDTCGIKDNWSAVCHNVIQIQLYVKHRLYRYVVKSVSIVVNVLQRLQCVPRCAVAEYGVNAGAARTLHSFLYSTSAVGRWECSIEGSAGYIFYGFCFSSLGY